MKTGNQQLGVDTTSNSGIANGDTVDEQSVGASLLHPSFETREWKNKRFGAGLQQVG